MENREVTMVEELLKIDDDSLKPHEVNFIDDLDKRNRKNPDYELTDRQLAWLERLWNKHCL